MADKVRITTEVSVQDVCPDCECTTIHPMADCRDINCACHEISPESDGTYGIVDYAGEDEDYNPASAPKSEILIKIAKKSGWKVVNVGRKN